MHSKRNNMLMAFLLTTFTLLLVSCSSPNETKDRQTVTISAASSLQDVLTEVEKEFEDEHPSIDVVFNYGASGSLKQQISQGAPVDIYFSASQATFQELLQEEKIVKEHSSTLLKNRLTLISPTNEGSLASIEDLAGETIERIGIGTPESVPAGYYAEEVLHQLRLLDSLEHKIVYAKNVRQVLTYVENGDVQAGFVYNTDALTSDQVKVVSHIKEDLHSPILYPVGVTTEGATKKEVLAVFEFFHQKKVLSIAEKYGFLKGDADHG